MRRSNLFLFLIGVALLFASCSKTEDKEYYSVLGNYLISNDSALIISDEDERLLIHNPGDIPSTITSNERVIAYFTMVGGQKPAGIDYIIDVYGIADVLHKDITAITETNADSIGEDPMFVRNIWVAKDYLNVNFDYYGNTQVHYINLIRVANDPPDDGIVELELRHNDNNDSYGYLVNGFVTFNLNSIQDNAADSVVLHIKAKEYNNQIYNKSFTYKY